MISAVFRLRHPRVAVSFLVATLFFSSASAVMPNKRAPEAIVRRRDRAKALGFWKEVPFDKTHIAAARRVASHGRLAIRSLELHAEHDDLNDRPHHYAAHATLAAQRALGPTATRQALSVHRAAGRAKHLVSQAGCSSILLASSSKVSPPLIGCSSAFLALSSTSAPPTNGCTFSSPPSSGGESVDERLTELINFVVHEDIARDAFERSTSDRFSSLLQAQQALAVESGQLRQDTDQSISVLQKYIADLSWRLCYLETAMWSADTNRMRKEQEQPVQ